MIQRFGGLASAVSIYNLPLALYVPKFNGSVMLYGSLVFSIFVNVSLHVQSACVLFFFLLQPTGKGPRLPEVYCVISRLGCFDLFSTVSSVLSSSLTHMHVNT